MNILKLLKSTIQTILKTFNLGITTHTMLNKLKELPKTIAEYERVLSDFKKLSDDKKNRLISILNKSCSQSRQDLFVLTMLNFKTNGYFIEFGVTDGKNLSNSYLLEKEFAWKGIVAEPAKIWHKDLHENRNCYIEEKCVWKESDKTFDFNESVEPELSTLQTFSNKDGHKQQRKNSNIYKVQTISLLDLLEKFKAPQYIDYLSIDTEGSEFEILKSFDFDKYKIGIITCEHNDTANREKIFLLLISKGYTRKYPGFSQYDDWYVLSNLKN